MFNLEGGANQFDDFQNILIKIMSGSTQDPFCEGPSAPTSPSLAYRERSSYFRMRRVQIGYLY